MSTIKINHIFIDTEFENFNCPLSGLLSIAGASDTGKSWYGINADRNLETCSPFVLEHVIPILYNPKPDVEECLPILGTLFCEWIEAHEGPAVVVVDYIGDWLLFLSLLDRAGCWPRNLSRQPEAWQEGIAYNETHTTFQDARALMAQYLADRKWKAHNALADAEANRHAWLVAGNKNSATLSAVC